MAARTVSVPLIILGRKFSMSCSRDVRNRMLDAAEILNTDLQNALGTREASNSELIDNLIALALEYLLRELTDSDDEDAKRVADATERLQNALKGLPSA